MKIWNTPLKLIVLVLIPFGIVFTYFYKNRTNIFVANYAPKSSMILNEFEKNGLPDFNFQDSTGENFNLKNFGGKILLLNFWATWCDPCVEEFPSMLRLIKKYKGDIVLVAVSLDENPKDLNKFLKIFKVDPAKPMKGLVLLNDPNKVLSEKFHLVALPETIIAGRDLKMIRKISGSENWDSPMARRFFDDILKKN